MLRVCFTGYRPAKLPFKCSPSDEKYLRFCQKAHDVLAELIQSDSVHFLSGMAQGADTILANIVLGLKENYQAIKNTSNIATLECVLPFPGQTKGWSTDATFKHSDILAKCDKVTVISETYTPQSYMQRNRYLVDNSDMIIAVYDGQPGGSKNTLNYAFKSGKRAIILNPQSLHTIQIDMLI